MAKLLFRTKLVFGEANDSFVEMRAFEVPFSSEFLFGVKFSLVFVHRGECVLRYDNERGKGAHRHFNAKETKLEFESIDLIVVKFLEEVERIRKQKGV